MVIAHKQPQAHGVANEGALGLRSWHTLPHLMELPHRHSDIEINFLLAGAITYIHRERVVTIPSNRLAIFWGAIPHQLTERPADCDMCIFTIPLETFLAWKLPTSLTQRLLMGELLTDTTEEYSAADRCVIPRWHQDLHQQRAFIALKEMEARCWRFALASQPAVGPAKGTPETTKASQMARYIVDHYAEPLSIDAIAAAVGLHPNYAMTCFKQTFGMTVLEYLLQYRIAQAQRLLITSDENVLTIALQTGFSSTSRFYAAFQKYVGCAPRVYRQLTIW